MDSFVFRKSWWVALAGLPSGVRRDVTEAVMHYCFEGSLPTLKPMAGAVFAMIRKDIDSDTARAEAAEAAAEARRDGAARRARAYRERKRAGKGGAARHASVTQASRSVTRDEAQVADNEAVKADAAENADAAQTERAEKPRARVKEYNNKNISSVDKGLLIKKKKENAQKKETEASSVDAKAQAFVSFFNETMAKAGALIPHGCRLTPRRRAAIAARAAQCGCDSLRKMVEKAAASPFLNGAGANAWVADIDWLLRPNNFVKVIEGNYDINNKTTNSYANIKTNEAADRRRGVLHVDHNPEDYGDHL